MSDTRHSFHRVHHVQVGMPPGQEDTARTFYARVLGLAEVRKPSALALRGGVWFHTNGVELHLGAELDFRPARKAHPAFAVDRLESLAAHLAVHGVPPRWDGDYPGHRRFYADDPFGNRLEFLEPRKAA